MWHKQPELEAQLQETRESSVLFLSFPVCTMGVAVTVSVSWVHPEDKRGNVGNAPVDRKHSMEIKITILLQNS